MKRATLFLLAAMTASSCLFAQTTKNPFSELGYTKHITYTSSKGEFEEFHNNADIVEIGSVYFNTKTKKVVGYINEQKKMRKWLPPLLLCLLTLFARSIIGLVRMLFV